MPFHIWGSIVTYGMDPLCEVFPNMAPNFWNSLIWPKNVEDSHSLTHSLWHSYKSGSSGRAFLQAACKKNWANYGSFQLNCKHSSHSYILDSLVTSFVLVFFCLLYLAADLFQKYFVICLHGNNKWKWVFLLIILEN